MDHTERKNHISHHNRAEIVSKRFYKEIEYISSQGKRCYQPYLEQFLRQVWFVKPHYFMIRDRINLGKQQGNINTGFNLNNRDGQLQYKLEGGRLFASRPNSDLLVQIISPDQMGFTIEEGILHYAYHIVPDQMVEGEMGSTVRFNFNVLEGVNEVDLVYLIAPLKKGEKAPKIEINNIIIGEECILDGLQFQVNYRGHQDSFNFKDDLAFSRKDGPSYRF